MIANNVSCDFYNGHKIEASLVREHYKSPSDTFPFKCEALGAVDLTETILNKDLSEVQEILDENVESFDEFIPDTYLDQKTSNVSFRLDRLESSIYLFFGLDPESSASDSIKPEAFEAARQHFRIGEERTYEVDMERTETRYSTFRIPATSAEDAQRKARAAAANYDFHDAKSHDPLYAVTEIRAHDDSKYQQRSRPKV